MNVEDFESVMRKLGNLIDEVKHPPLNPSLDKDELLSILEDIYRYFGPYSVVVDGRSIDDVEYYVKSALESVRNAKKAKDEKELKKFLKQAEKTLDDTLDPLLENIVEDS